VHPVSLLQRAASMTPSISADLGTSVAAAIPVETSAWQHSAVMLSSVKAVRDIPPLPPLLYLKTHKTGSSTLTNLIHRMADRRNLSIMLPSGIRGPFLGYPLAFPGEDNALYYGPPTHQFDIICDHAVLNTALMSAYLKPNPHFITSVREPLEQMQSSKDYRRRHVPGHRHKPSLQTWEEYLDKLESSNNHGKIDNVFRAGNQQAYDLGWYDFVGGSTEFDRNDTKIREWLATLDKALSSIVITEYFDEGLALFCKKNNLDIEEFHYVRLKSDNEEKVYPTEGQRQRIAKLNTVDRALYAHLNQSFWQEWFSSNVSRLDANVLTLKQLNQKLQHSCDEGDLELCPRSITMDNHEYFQRHRLL